MPRWSNGTLSRVARWHAKGPQKRPGTITRYLRQPEWLRRLAQPRRKRAAAADGMWRRLPKLWTRLRNLSKQPPVSYTAPSAAEPVAATSRAWTVVDAARHRLGMQRWWQSVGELRRCLLERGTYAAFKEAWGDGAAKYTRLMQSHPVKTNSLTAALLCSVGDGLAQALQLRAGRTAPSAKTGASDATRGEGGDGASGSRQDVNGGYSLGRTARNAFCARPAERPLDDPHTLTLTCCLLLAAQTGWRWAGQSSPCGTSRSISRVARVHKRSAPVAPWPSASCPVQQPAAAQPWGGAQPWASFWRPRSRARCASRTSRCSRRLLGSAGASQLPLPAWPACRC